MAGETPDATTFFSQLSFQRKRFVALLVADPNMNATQAAIGAKYSPVAAAQQASRLLRTVKVRRAIAELLKDTAPSVEEIAATWDRVSRASLDDFYSKVEYEESTTMQKPLAESIAALEESIDFSEEYAARAVTMLGLVDEDKEEYLAKSQFAIDKKRLRLLELQMQLERNPDATYDVPGPPIKKYRMDLDLVKAQERGVLDLAKSITEGRNGTGLTLRDTDAALDKLARMAGAYEKDNNQLAGTEVIIIGGGS
jgi:phage terminase small subunit